MPNTPNLDIPLKVGTDYVNYESHNNAMVTIDSNALSIVHLKEKSHFDLWKPSTEYKLQDAVRTTDIASFGILICTKRGISSATSPPVTGQGIGNVIVDGSLEWTLKTLGGDGSSGGDGGLTVVKIPEANDLTLLPFTGEVKSLYVFTSIPFNSDVIITFERLGTDDFKAQNNNRWQRICNKNLTLLADTVLLKYEILPSDINKNIFLDDMITVRCNETIGITFEIVIEKK